MTTPDLSAEERATVERFEAGTAAEESAVERVARAIAEHSPRYRSSFFTGEPDWIECGHPDAEVSTCSWRSDPEADVEDVRAAHHRHVAQAALAAMRPAPDTAKADEGAADEPYDRHREEISRDLLRSWANAASNAGCPPAFVARMRTFADMHDRHAAEAPYWGVDS